jgi:glycosyltransferase involved in cell wall biosynthesis
MNSSGQTLRESRERCDSQPVKMNLAIMGIRGIPACYGGFETVAEELSSRLVERGHSVTVYGRSNIMDPRLKSHKGVRLITLPTISHKYFDTVCHTFLCVLHAFFEKYDAILICNAANSVFSFLPRLVGKKVVVNVDGIERRRKKWSTIGKLWYLFGELFSVMFPNAIISDARVIQKYYKKRYRKNSVFIPYGARTNRLASKDILMQHNLKPNEYFLYVSRLEPENNAHLVIKAFEEVKTHKKLVIVGDAPYSKKYISSLRKTVDPRIVFTGFVFGEGYFEFQSHAYSYIHATEVGGTHPALIEAMGFGNGIIASGTPENIEVLDNTGLIYKKSDVEDLRSKIAMSLESPNILVELGKRAERRARELYDWDQVTDDYERLFMHINGYPR